MSEERRFARSARLSGLALAWCALAGCAARPLDRIPAGPPSPLRALGHFAEDDSPKADLRMVPPEVTMRTILQLFGGLAPLDAQSRARGADGNALFDTWDDYVSALGFPDHRLDVPRQTQTNALMVATLERLGIALCDRAVEHDLIPSKGNALPSVGDRLIFAFDLPSGEIDSNGFAERFDVLHKTFLGYPARLAPATRTARYFALYRDIVAGHAKADPRSRFSPREAAWAAVCYGLVRHPEFQLY